MFVGSVGGRDVWWSLTCLLQLWSGVQCPPLLPLTRVVVWPVGEREKGNPA